MTANDPATVANMLRARTLRGIPPHVHGVPFASIADLLATRALATPEASFLRYYNDDTSERASWTYGTLNARVNQFANYLAQLGLRRGECVATLAFNHPDTVLLYLACWTIGATVAPQNAGEDDTRIGFTISNAAARVVLASPPYAERAHSICAAIASVEQVITLDATLHAALDAQPTIYTTDTPSTLDDPALLVYTSGTTGAPKGVQLTQYNLLIDADAIAAWHGLDATTRLMCILPIHHVNGIVVTLVTPLYVGCATVLNRGFKVSTFWRRLAEERVQMVSLVPTILQFLCEAREDVSALDLSAFRYVICGAGTLPMALAQRFERQFNRRVLHGYGLSETTCYSCFLPTDLDDAAHAHWMSAHGYPSIGCPIAANQMNIHDAEGRELPDGEKGEIVVRGHNIMLGYFERPDANAETFKWGWFRSGDEGFQLRDDTGRQFFFISGRIKELINRGGVKYSPFEIEELLLELPGVRIGLAIAFENSWYGEEVGAYVVREPGAALTEEQVLRHCRARMPWAKSPKVVVFGQEIPVTATGKYQRMRLRELFAAWATTQFRER
ncbi:MAG: acyl--CoA ligase [Roseiflexaceae bacterium]|nr:acyl--CoA ligase [Roseiflexaceae bacterium]